MTKGRLEAEFEAHYPTMLRLLVNNDPSQRPDPGSSRNLTETDKDILAAEAAAGDEHFCEAEEYKDRLASVLER